MKKQLLLFLLALFAMVLPAHAETETVTFDYSSGGSTTMSQGDITIVLAKGEGGTAPGTTYSPLRLYAKNTMTITTSTGKLVSISFTTDSSNGSFLTGASTNVGTFNSTAKSWTAPATTATTSVVLTNGTVTSGHTKIKSVSVTYETKTDSEGPSTGTTFKLVTNLNEISSGYEYLFVSKVGTQLVAMSPLISGSKFTGINVTENDNGEILITNENVQKLTANSINGNKISWKYGNQYLLGQSGGTNLTFSNEDSSSTVSILSEGRATIKYTTTGNSREILYSTSTTPNVFGHYASSNAQNGYNIIYIYKSINSTENPQPNRIDYIELDKYSDRDDITFELGESYQLELGEKHPNINYEFDDYSDGEISIDDNGLITATKVGDVFVTATWEADKTFNASSEDGINFIVTVTEPSTVDPGPTPEPNASYMITFDDSSSDATSDVTSTTLLGYIIEGKNYVESASDISKVYKGKTGLKFGSNSAIGKVTLNLSELGQVEVSKIVVTAAAFNTSNPSLKVNGISQTISGTSLKDYEYVFPNTPALSSITLETGNLTERRCYVKGITVYYYQEVGEVHYRVTDGKTIEDEEITVNLGDEFKFWADPADNIEVFIEDEDNDTPVSASGSFKNGVYTWTIDKYYESYVTVIPYAKGAKGESFEFLLNVNMPTPEKPVITVGGEPVTGESMYVIAGTEIEINCENAIAINGTVGSKSLTKESLPYKFTVTEKTPIKVKGVNQNGTEGEELEFTFYIGEVDKDMPPVGSRFRQILNLNWDELKGENYYVIGRKNVSEDKSIVMSINDDQAKGRINSTFDVSLIDDVPTVITNEGDVEKDKTFAVLTIDSPEVLIFYLENQDDQWGLRTVNYGDGLKSSQKYLTSKDGKNDLSLVDSFTPVYISFTNNNNVKISFEEGSDLSIATPKEGAYFNCQTSGYAIQLYQYTKANLFEPEYDDLTIVEGGDSQIILANTETPEISYRVKGNTTIISIEEGNVVKAQERVGKAVVVASWPESIEWFAGRTEFNVTVKKKLNSDEFFFRHSEVRGKADVGVVAQAVYYIGDGTVSYSIYRDSKEGDDKFAEDEIRINHETGMIRPDDLIKPAIGETYTVVARVTETDEHVVAEASYNLVIEAPEAGASGDPEDVKVFFNFTDTSNPYGFFEDFNSGTTSNSTSGYFSDYEGNINKKTNHNPVTQLKGDNIEVNLSGDYRWFNTGSIEAPVREFRLYTGTGLEFIAQKGTIVSITFDGATRNTFNGTEGGSWSSGTWTPSVGHEVSSVKFISDGKPKIKSITVITSKPTIASDVPEAQLSFNDEDRVVNIYAGDLTPLPELFHNDALSFEKLQFDIDEVSEDNNEENSKNYEIFPNDYDDVEIVVNNPGVYTFRAFYEGNDFLNGMAILRLNVFPRLSVLPTSSDNPEGGMLADDDRNEHPALTIVEPDENNGNVSIALPTLDELNDALKYSTVNVSKVEIKHGNVTEVYSVEGTPTEPAPADARRRAESTETTEKHISEMPDTFNFFDDGYVKYTLVYANTEDFSIEETVHVVLMPKKPEVTTYEEATKNFITLTPNSTNERIQYMKYIYGQIEEPEFPETIVIEKSRSNAASNEEGYFIGYGDPGEAVEVTPLDGMNALEYTTVKYRTIKDLNDIVDKDAVPSNPYLISEDDLVSIDYDGIPTGVEDLIGDADDAEVRYFNLQGIRIYKPAKGEIYIRVQGRNATKVIF